jgi:type I restriction enzyme S subunit
VTELPNGWAETTIGEVLQFNYGKGLPERDRSGNGFPVYGSNGVVGYHEKALVSAESLIIGRKGSVGEVHHSRGPCWPIDTTYFVDEFSGMPARFWYYVLKGLDLGGLNRATAIPGLNREDAYHVDVVLPPQTEQKRIAYKLDAALARVDACRERLDRVPAILKRFRQAVLAAATAGALTEEWCEGEGLPEWDTALLGHLILDLKNGLSPKPAEQPPGEPILRISSVRPFQVNQSDVRYLKTDADVEAYRLRPKDLLFTRYNGSLEFVGVCAMVRQVQLAGLVYPDKLIRVRANPSLVLPEWIEITVNSPAIRALIETTARTSAGQTGIAGRDLKALVIPLPSLWEQAKIVRRVEALFAYADRLASHYTVARTQVEHLTPALLARAFRGELVPQDPNDEPTSVLLERIRAARAATGEKPPRKVRAERKLMTTTPTTDTLKEIIRGLPTDQLTMTLL